MKCPDISDLERFVTHSLSDPDSRSVEAHLSSCDVCRGAMDDVRENLAVARSVRRMMDDSGVHGLSPAPPSLPTIDGYRVLREIGRGGMGIVYEAEQQNPRRRVALKIIDHRGRGDSERLFNREVRALARLKHAGIAAILEAGHSSDGRPYFAMELVDGAGLRDFVDSASQMSVRERVTLFRRICDAIAYAHQRGVLHRDIKPANVLIPTGETQPKILDFGLARVLEADDETPITVTTEVGRVQGTLPYMSPEQARGDAGEIDMRSDVYSLGVMLYEMLCGTLPLKLDKARLLESVRIICETPPARPTAHNTALDRDIETILLKTLEKDPDRRYPTAAALRDEIDRYLANQAIEARPPTLSYQLSKLVARHRLAAALIGTVVVLLAGFGPAMGYLYRKAESARKDAARQAEIATEKSRIADEQSRLAQQHAEAANRERDKADAQARTSQRVTDFLVDSFTLADPDQTAGEKLTARELLDRGREKLEKSLVDEPRERVALVEAMGRAYLGLGARERAEPLLEETLRLYESLDGPEALSTANALEDLAQLRNVQTRLADAEALLHRSLEIRRKLLSPESRPIATALVNLADVATRSGRMADAEALLIEAMRIFETLEGPADEHYAGGLLALGNLRAAQGRAAEAETYLRKTVEVLVRDLPTHRVLYAIAINNLANVIKETGKTAESESLLRESLQVRREIYGSDSLVVATALNNLGRLLLDSGRSQDAEPLLREGLDIRLRLDARGVDAASSMENLALTLSEMGKSDEAESLLQESLDIRREKLGDHHPKLANNLSIIGPILERKGDLPGAERSYRDALDILHAAYGEEHPEIGRVMMRLGRNLGLQDRLDDADSMLRAALDMQRRVLGVDHANVGAICGEIGDIAVKREQFAEAEPMFREQLVIFEKRLPPAHPRTTLSRIKLGQTLLRQSKFADAEAPLQTAYNAAKPMPSTSVAGTKLLETSRAALIELYTATNRNELAAQLINENE